jgi:hypothetical protein
LRAGDRHPAFQIWLRFLLMDSGWKRKNKPMNHIPSIVLACALAIPALAQDAKTNAASAAVLTAPLVLTNGYFFLAAEQQEVAGGGKAVFNFSVTNAGNYVIETLVSAPDGSSNSFYVNIDAQPEDPEMIWDIDLTTGFEKRVVSWRGNGDASTDEITPKPFKLEPGAHTLVIVGREPGTLLKSLTIRPAPPQQPAKL